MRRGSGIQWSGLGRQGAASGSSARAALLWLVPLLVINCGGDSIEGPSIWEPMPSQEKASLSWANEPHGFRVVEDRDWAEGLGRWRALWNDNGRLGIVANNSPLPSARVLQQYYPRGLEGGGEGTAEVHFEIPDSIPGDEIYLGLWVRVNLQWVGHPGSGVNKFSHIGVSDGGGLLWAELYGEGGAPLTFMAVSQLAGCDDGAIRSNYTFQRGRWHKIEIHLRLGSKSGRSGTFRVWANGQRIVDRAICTPDIDDARISFVRLTGTWGGIGGRKPRDDYMQWGPVRISIP